MASTNKTTNYELSQFEGTDKPSWEADYNADMLSIDTNLKAVSDVADGASGSISSLADRVTAAEGNITTNANDIDALEARADALEAGETAADGRLDAIEAEQIIQNGAIESNTRLGYNLARPYDSASTYSVGDYVLFQDTLYKCTTAIATGEAFDPTKWLAIKATDEIAAGGYTLPTASASVLGGVKVGSGLSIDASGVLSAGGGVEYIDIPLTAFTPSDILFRNKKYTDTQYTDASLTSSAVVAISPNNSIRLYKIGNIRIIYGNLKIEHNAVTIPANFNGTIATKDEFDIDNTIFQVTTTSPIEFGRRYDDSACLINYNGAITRLIVSNAYDTYGTNSFTLSYHYCPIFIVYTV